MATMLITMCGAFSVSAEDTVTANFSKDLIVRGSSTYGELTNDTVRFTITVPSDGNYEIKINAGVDNGQTVKVQAGSEIIYAELTKTADNNEGNLAWNTKVAQTIGILPLKAGEQTVDFQFADVPGGGSVMPATATFTRVADYESVKTIWYATTDGAGNLGPDVAACADNGETHNYGKNIGFSGAHVTYNVAPARGKYGLYYYYGTYNAETTSVVVSLDGTQVGTYSLQGCPGYGTASKLVRLCDLTLNGANHLLKLANASNSGHSTEGIMLKYEGNYVADKVTIPARNFIDEGEYASSYNSFCLFENAVQVSQSSHQYNYAINVGAGNYDLSVFYSTRAGLCNIKVLLDGTPLGIYEVAESVGWGAGEATATLANVPIPEGDHIITFTYASHPEATSNYYFLQNFTLTRTGDYRPSKYTYNAKDFDATTSVYTEGLGHTGANGVIVALNTYKFDYIVNPGIGDYKLSAFYGTYISPGSTPADEGRSVITVYVDGTKIGKYPVTHSQSYCAGSAYVELDTIRLSDGEHKIRFTYEADEGTTYYSLGNFTLERVDVVADSGTSGWALKYDKNPYKGSGTYITDTTVTLDCDYTSVGIDLGSKQTIKKVILTDSDSISRVEKRDLALYVSDDNLSYTRIKNWDFLKKGSKYYLYNIDAQARYVKVHCTYDSYDDNVGTFVGTKATMLSVETENTEFLGAAGGTFTKYVTHQIKNNETSALYDYAMYIPTEDLGLPTGEYKSDMSDIRFAKDDDTKTAYHHYYDGKGFYVRIPYIAASATQNIRVYYGNANATSTSNGEGTFEIEYGNKTLMDFNESHINCEPRVKQMPNGDVICIAKLRYGNNNYIYRSKDGGRTWGEPKVLYTAGKNEDGSNKEIHQGGFLVDGEKIFFLFQIRHTLEDTDFVYILSTDNGYTWTEPQIINKEGQPGCSYTNPLITSIADGDGPNVDYVFQVDFEKEGGGFAAWPIYSKDGGATWIYSESIITLPAQGGEAGISEGSVVELSDGRLKIVSRAQYEGVTRFYESYSYDYGVTWEETPVESNITSVNTQPMLYNYNEDIMLVWAGHNSLGGYTYSRFPIAIAYSSDDTQTWNQHLDVLANTSWSAMSIANRTDIITEPDFTFTNYEGSDSMILSWWKQSWSGGDEARGILIDDFDDYLYKTQGAYDSFEGTNTKNEGWHNGQYSTGSSEYSGSSTSDKVSITSTSATNGAQALKVTDTESAVVRASRTIPSMKKGTISFNANIPSGMTSDVNVEIKSTYNVTSFYKAPMTIKIATDGKVYVRENEAFTETTKTVSLDAWHKFEVEFDVNASDKKAKLYVDDEFVTDFLMNIVDGEEYISCVQFSDGSSSNAVAADSFYIDEFIATKTIKSAPSVEFVSDKDFVLGYNTTTKEVSIKAKTSGTGTIIVASYSDTNGARKLVDMIPFADKAFGTTTQYIDASELDLEGVKYVKVFLVKNMTSMKPLCESVEIPLS